MSPKNPGAPKKPRWSQAKKASARRSSTSAPASRAGRKPAGRFEERDDTRRGGYRGRDDRRGHGPRDDRAQGGPRSSRFGGDSYAGDRYDRDDRPRFDRDDRAPRFDRDDFRRGTPRRRDEDDRSGRRGDGRGRQQDVDGGWSAGRGRAERRDGRYVSRGDDRGRPYDRRDDRGGAAGGDRSAREDRFSRGERSMRRDERRGDARPVRGHDRHDGFSRDDRAGRDDRFPRPDDRRFERDDRRPRRDDDRGARGFDRGDDRGRRFERDDRFARRDRDDRYSRRDRDDRYSRRDRDDRYARRDDGRDDGSPAPRREHHRAPADAPVVRSEQLHRKEVPPAEPVDMTTNGFAALGVPEPMVKRLARDGITTPFPIQEATIPDALAGRDVLGRGRTGSGKTLAFGLPLLARLAEGEKAAPNRPRAIVLSPTRELAMQISDALQPLVHVMGLRHKLVAGGMPYPPQFDALDRGVDVLIATPGRLTDLIERGACSLEACEFVVLDEADHMADMGFLEEITVLLDQVPAGGQRLLFSATLDKGIDTLVEAYLNDPVTHSTDEAQASVTTMAHHVLLVEPAHKKVVTAHVANRGGHTIVFVRTKLGADRVAMQLREQGVFAAALHGGLSQAGRNRVLSAFKDGTLPVLVATDVAARGIHVDDVGVVLQVDPPADHKDYLHRAGRTARAGEDGTVVTLALPHQKRLMQRIADQAGLEVTPEKVVPGDARLHELTGATRPVGDPIPEERLRRLMEPPPRPRRGGFRSGGGGYRSPRDGGRGGRGGRRRD